MSVFNQSRSRIIRLIFLAVFIVITAQLFNLQVISGKYKKLADEQAILKKIVYPSRGIIYDRKGRAILNNIKMFDLMVTPAEVKNIDTLTLCRLLAIDTIEFKKRIKTSIDKNKSFRPSVFEPLLTADKLAVIEENMWRFSNGFFLQERPVRLYPYNAAAHILGYIAEVNQREIERSGDFYRMGDYIGKSGLESYYENILMGERGVQFLLRDNFNRVQGPYENGEFDTAAVAGRGLRTYIDIELQQLAEKMMTNKVGAVVAIDPKTGGILAMASGPTFNPNDLTGSAFSKNYSKLALDVSGPLLNRAIKGQYPPGSTFKPIGALVALEEGVIDANFGYPCTGRYYACGHGKPACTHSNAGHAANLRLSIANSCNSYYAHIYRMTVDNPKYGSVKKGYEKWHDYMNLFGLGVRLGIDLPSEDKGNIPDSAVYNKAYRSAWNSCTNLTLGIGQDMMLATPLQLANAMCMIANKGYYYTPHLVEKIDNETAQDTILKPFRVRNNVLTHLSNELFEEVISGMQDVVETGTARSAAIPGINVCAKTGTAENFIILDRRRIQLKDNSVFVCFAPRENPKIAIAVVVENAGFGGTWAGPISSILMEKYLNDTLRPERLAKVEELANANIMPSYLKRKQFIEDSTRAYWWFKTTKDSNYIRRFISFGQRQKDPSPPKLPKRQLIVMNIPDDKQRRNTTP
ncbi:MAG: penicillin-binding protein 2 [Chitinophagaceae bacterium]|nr:penicillin-binding protein 2 [Chitinophagaceae bacterium]MBN8666847.1 penicillin-binding protein 2 [Chitinophagales bacterium]